MPIKIKEFQNIQPIETISSIMEHGILSHEKASRLPHKDISMQLIQDKRIKKTLPNGLDIHDHANLYFDARNPMMGNLVYVQMLNVDSLCVLRISADVLALKGVMISDRNASSDYASFLQPGFINQLDFDKIYAEDWTHPNDKIEYWKHKSIKCAEILVPHCIDCSYIIGAYVASSTASNKLIKKGFDLEIKVKPHIFFL